jgi:hypothetical protein
MIYIRCTDQAMKISFALIPFVLCAITAEAQQPAPEVVLRASQCLQAKGFIESPPSTQNLLFGYFLDSISYPGKHVAYITQYTKPDRSQGFVYAVFYSVHNGHTFFDIQNNARFIRRKNGIDFVDPPLGGEWTQQHLIEGIERAAKEPAVSITVKSLTVPLGASECRSYTDPQ